MASLALFSTFTKRAHAMLASCQRIAPSSWPSWNALIGKPVSGAAFSLVRRWPRSSSTRLRGYMYSRSLRSKNMPEGLRPGPTCLGHLRPGDRSSRPFQPITLIASWRICLRARKQFASYLSACAVTNGLLQVFRSERYLKYTQVALVGASPSKRVMEPIKSKIK
ncbi:hypothetical protein F4780DRAFT_496388 [Xylariomycetidae sp. FL0641]|nr:hypothetical protein F4780DRAFT_496388 [Xylariomycetidae sp. FL0641]